MAEELIPKRKRGHVGKWRHPSGEVRDAETYGSTVSEGRNPNPLRLTLPPAEGEGAPLPGPAGARGARSQPAQPGVDRRPARAPRFPHF